MWENMSLFIVNYRRELRMGVDIRRKEKMEKATEFAVRMKKVQEKAGAVLKKSTREDEVASGQRKERDRRMESRR